MTRWQAIKWGAISALPMLVFLAVIGVSAVPLEVKVASKDISEGRLLAAHSRLTAFLKKGSGLNHHAWAYRALAHAKMGHLSEAKLDAERSSQTKWRFGNGGWLNLNILAGASNCTSIMTKLPLPRKERIYMDQALCHQSKANNPLKNDAEKRAF